MEVHTARIPAGSTAPRARLGRLPSAPSLAFGAGLVALTAFLLHQGRGTTFYFDEWAVWGNRYGLEWLFDPINDHLSAVPLGVFDAITRVLGAGDYLPYRLSVLLWHGVFLTLLFVWTRRRVGGWLSLALVAPIGVLSGAWLVLLMPFTGLFQIGPLIAAVGALLALERRDRTGDLVACALLLFGLLSAGSALAVIAGVAVYLAWERSGWRRLWIPAVPAVVYAAWSLGYSTETLFQLRDLGLLADYLARGLASGLGAYSSLGPEWGRTLALGLVAGAAALVWRRQRLTPVQAGVIAMGAGYWALIAVGRGPELGPEEVRYVYANAVFALLIVLAFVPRVRPSRNQVAVAGALVLVVMAAQVQGFRDAARDFRAGPTQSNRADVFVLGATRERVDPAFIPPGGDPVLQAESYFEALDARGGPTGMSEEELLAAPEPVRRHADGTFVAALEVSAGPGSEDATSPAPLPAPSAVSGAALTGDGECRAVSPEGGGPAVVELPVAEGGGVTVQAGDTAPVELRAARYGGWPEDPLRTVEPAEGQSFLFPADRAETPWRLRVSGAAPFELCGRALSG